MIHAIYLLHLTSLCVWCPLCSELWTAEKKKRTLLSAMTGAIVQHETTSERRYTISTCEFLSLYQFLKCHMRKHLSSMLGNSKIRLLSGSKFASVISHNSGACFSIDRHEEQLSISKAI